MILVSEESDEAMVSFGTLIVSITAVINVQTTKMWNMDMKCAVNRMRVFS